MLVFIRPLPYITTLLKSEAAPMSLGTLGKQLSDAYAKNIIRTKVKNLKKILEGEKDSFIINSINKDDFTVSCRQPSNQRDSKDLREPSVQSAGPGTDGGVEKYSMYNVGSLPMNLLSEINYSSPTIGTVQTDSGELLFDTNMWEFSKGKKSTKTIIRCGNRGKPKGAHGMTDILKSLLSGEILPQNNSPVASLKLVKGHIANLDSRQGSVCTSDGKTITFNADACRHLTPKDTFLHLMWEYGEPVLCAVYPNKNKATWMWRDEEGCI